MSPVPPRTVCAKVPKLPAADEASKYGSNRGRCVCMATVAPKAAAPLVDVPAPRWICIDSTDEAKSGMLTQKTP